MGDVLVAAGAGLAVLVELLEALAILLAVGSTRSWRDAWLGAAAAVLACAGVAVIAGPVVIEQLGLRTLRLVIGAALLWFGGNWLRKNVLRLAGRKKRSSSAEEFVEVAEEVQGATDWVAFVVAFKGVFLEGVEIVLIVTVLAGRPSGSGPAIAGAIAAGVLVTILGLALRKPLARIPETELKFVVGLMLTTFGIFFVGEGLGLHWPGGDAALLYILATVLAASLGGVRALAVAALLLAGCGSAAPVPPKVVTIVQDDAELLHRPPAQIARTLDALRTLGTDWVRVTAGWDAVEPRRGSFNWSPLDRLHREATDRGLALNIDIAFNRPAWARWTDYAAFAEQVARRYPDAAAFTVWNEPNLGVFLRPQWRPDGSPLSPDVYRRMLYSAVPRIRDAAPDAKVLIGATSSTGETHGTGDTRMAPLTFLRALTCVEPADTPACRGYKPLPGDGWSHHPYSQEFAPWQHDPKPGTARMADLGRLIGELHAERDRFQGPMPVYLTEYAYQTNPPDPTWHVTPDEQARYLGEDEEIARSHPEVRSVAQFLVRDLPPSPGKTPAERWGDYQSGLLFADGRPKPALYAFGLPLTVHRAGPGRVTLWGLDRRGPGHVTVQAGGRTVADLHTRADGTFTTTVAADPGATFVLIAGRRNGAPVYGARR